ncbi:DUF7285 family protein [Halorussus amylolyticus]|uniref:DUF7285 family protein n=1 Tax=Halorussus amylolyticus TaxID=1126242 RepID=UPI00104C196C|nr:hypothetical protein [Halorussus amylolyticus]
MSRWSGRAQVEPLAALVAVFAVGLAVSAYAGVLDAALPTPDRDVAEPTGQRVERAVTDAGVVEPDRLADGLHAGPDGYRLNLTLAADGETWREGPPVPDRADAPDALDTAEFVVSVRVGPGRVQPGRLRVAVWS